MSRGGMVRIIKAWLGVLLAAMMLLSLVPVVISSTTVEAAATTSLAVTKYDAHGNVLSTQTVTYQWMEANLPVQGNGTVHYYAQGPTFDNTNFNTVWNPAEDFNVESRDYGRPKGTDVKDLCNLVGGATTGCTIRIKATDNFAKWFDYEDVYNPEARQGKLVICWYNADFGGYVPTYDTGMRLVFFADTSTNPDGWHAFGNWDMHETLPESRWHYYSGVWPSSSGLSVQIVSNIDIYEPKLISCNASGAAKESFAPGETAYVKGLGLAASTSYKLWIQAEPVSNNRLSIVDGEDPVLQSAYQFNAGSDPSGGQETVTTNASGDFSPRAIWSISPSATAQKYDIVADSQALGTIGTYDSKDFIDAPGWEGFAVGGAPVVPPVAAFTADVVSGTAPLTVHFSDESTGNPTAWAWDFDNDGAADSTAQNPTYTYDAAGIYTVKLTVTNLVGTDSEVKTDYITVTAPPAPVAAFTADLTTGSAPLTVQFSDESTGNPTAWAWDFDNDGAVDSTAQNPTHTYDTAGTYAVKLTVTNIVGSDDEVKTDYVTVTTPPLPIAAFSADLTTGSAPLTVQFSDESTGNPTAWAWDFDNDGAVDSTAQNPTHTYDTGGTYTVKLTVTNVVGSDDEVKTDYVTVTTPPLPVAAFSADLTSGTAPLTVYFTDQSAGNPTAWAWDFDGDGDVDSTEQSPSHVYDTAGTYTVKLTVVNTAGSDDELRTDYISVAAPPVPVAAFRAEVVSGPAPLTVHFTDTSAGNPTAWIWDFNNDGTADSTTRNPTYTYDTAGMYTVKLTVTNLAGSDSEVKTDYITVTLAALWGPYVTGTTTTSAVVSVKTNVASAVTVDYATEAEYTASGTYNLSAADGTDAQLHHIELTGLDPDTAYHYRVVFGAESTADCHFSTFPTSGQFNFVVVSDAQDQLPLFSQSERFKLVADSIAAQPDVAFVLITGDLVNDGSNLANWDRFFDASREMLANTTLYTALGNHEENDALYYEIFGLPAYYSFDCGDAHFAVLDSNMAISAQTTWLESDLDDSKAWKFVAFHHPLYTSDPNHFGGWANLRAEWEGLFQTYGVDAVWNGHFHAYERYLHDGVHYMVIGTGGGPLYKLGDERYDGYQSSLVNSLAYAKVTVDPTTGACIMDIIQVADVSANNAEVTTMYPPDSVFESVLLTQGWPNWDMNGDHVCNIADVVIMGLRWGETGDPGWIPEDVNQDGVVDMLDVAIMELHWRDTWDDT